MLQLRISSGQTRTKNPAMKGPAQPQRAASAAGSATPAAQEPTRCAAHVFTKPVPFFHRCRARDVGFPLRLGLLRHLAAQFLYVVDADHLELLHFAMFVRACVLIRHTNTHGERERNRQTQTARADGKLRHLHGSRLDYETITSRARGAAQKTEKTQ